MRLPDKSALHPTEGPSQRSMDKDQRLYSQAASAFAERRQNPRIAIRKPAYINFEPYNKGGVITDVSEGGLRFHMVEPLEQGGLVRLSMFLGATHQIDAVGELIWKDSTRRVGGLRFTVLPPETVNRIRNWAEAPDSATPVNAVNPESSQVLQRGENQGTQPSNALPRQPDSVPGLHNGDSEQTSAAKVPEFAQPLSPKFGPPQVTRLVTPEDHTTARPPWVPRSIRPAVSQPVAQSGTLDPRNLANPSPARWVPPAAYQQPPAMPWITHFDPDPPSRTWPFLRGVLGGIIICIMLGWAGWFAASRNLWPAIPFQFSNPFASHPGVSNPAAPLADLPSAETPNGAPNLSPSDSQSSGQGQPAASQEGAPLTGANPGANSPSDSNAQSGPSAQAQPDIASPGDASASISKQTPLGSSGSLQVGSAQANTATGLATPSTLSAARGSLPAASQPAAKVPAAPGPSRATDAGETQLNLALQYLDGRDRPRNPAAASQLLWSAVEKGNSSAETDLADLYLRGDGVARNCDQARVLLSAASGKGNTEAMQKLAELNRTGCR